MNKISTDHILALVSDLLLPFHEIKRQHRLPVGGRRLENDVEHSWTVSVLACALAPQIDADLEIGKVAQFALVHDLVETFAGDTKHFTTSDSFRTSKKEHEYAALEQIKRDFSAFPC
ncbi:MAG TPA: HD domain-containing protein [Candidatus Saccharimonadales bacterium]|jgi:putative hydrolase of HD superfamily